MNAVCSLGIYTRRFLFGRPRRRSRDNSTEKAGEEEKKAHKGNEKSERRRGEEETREHHLGRKYCMKMSTTARGSILAVTFYGSLF